MILRRGRAGAGGGSGGFTSGTSTSSESLRATAAEPDDVDDIIDPDDYNRRAQGLPSLPPMRPVTSAEARANPAARMHQVAAAGSAAYAKEYRLGLLGRLLMRGTPLDAIASQLGVSISTVEKDRAELRKRQREEARNLNADEMVGAGNAFYDEAQAMALRIASAEGTPVPMRLAGVRTALAANADRTRFLNTAGVFDALRFRRAETGDDLSDVQLLMARTSELLMQFAGGGADPEPPARRPAIRRRARSTDSTFGPMTFKDNGGTSSDGEVETI